MSESLSNLSRLRRMLAELDRLEAANQFMYGSAVKGTLRMSMKYDARALREAIKTMEQVRKTNGSDTRSTMQETD